jgi:hypothetical protein
MTGLSMLFADSVVASADGLDLIERGVGRETADLMRPAAVHL